MKPEEFLNIELAKLFEAVEEYREHDPAKVALKLGKSDAAFARIVSEQIYCRKKASVKIPSFNDYDLLFDRTALEQCSGQEVAEYKSGLIEGKSLIDLTGGLGIDDIYFARKFEKVVYCEKSKKLAEIFRFNLEQLNVNNIEINNSDSLEYLKNCDMRFDWIYIDPARREGAKRSVDFEFCSPNVYENMDLFFSRADNILIKAAPAFDISEAVKRFEYLYEVIIVSVNNECKETLLLLSKNSMEDVKVKAAVINSRKGSIQSYSRLFKNGYGRNISTIKKYFFEPDAGIIKAQLSDVLADKYNLIFINERSDFLTGDMLIEDFPGRVFEIENVLSFKDKLIKKYLNEKGIKRANVAKRAFRLSVADIRKRLNIKEGGEDFLFFTSDDLGNQIMIHAKYGRLYEV